jgi:putative hydrolase of the HAD superfamily
VAPRAALFDLDDTLTDSTGADERVWVSVAAVISEHLPEVDPGHLRERYVGLTEAHYVELAAGRVDVVTFRRRRLAEALAPWCELDDALFARYLRVKDRVLDETAAFPESLEVLRRLRSQGVRVGVLTNGPSDLQRQKLASCGLDGELDAVAISGEIGAVKPEREAFRHALALLGSDAAETAMIGDSLANDVEGARAAGFGLVIWLRPDAEPPAGVVGVRSLCEVPGALGLA